MAALSISASVCARGVAVAAAAAAKSERVGCTRQRAARRRKLGQLAARRRAR